MVEPIILSRGVDTLKINVKLKEQRQELPVELDVLFSAWQERAREQAKPAATTLTFHDARMTMLPNGAPAWKYLIKNDCLQLQVGPRLHLPMVCKVTFSSAYLWEVGNAGDALDEVHGFLVDIFGTQISLQAAQIDVCGSHRANASNRVAKGVHLACHWQEFHWRVAKRPGILSWAEPGNHHLERAWTPL
jgi:hypothetical protein